VTKRERNVLYVADTRRATAITRDSLNALRALAFNLHKHSHEPYAYDGEECQAGIEVLAKLLEDPAELTFTVEEPVLAISDGDRAALEWLVHPDRKWLRALAATTHLGPPITRAIAAVDKLLTRGGR
jgi:hypothetical protein